MPTGLYVSLSAQMALQKRLETIADNVANANTVGFRATGIKFEDVVTGTGDKSVDFASQGTNFLSGKAGGLTRTGDPYDFAVQGDAWFGIATPAGTVMTRDGRFTMSPAGELVTHEGYAVLDAGGAAIQLNPNDGPPVAGKDGTLRQDGKLVAAIGLFTFDAGPNVQRFGNSGVIPAGRPVPVVDDATVGVEQGFLEQSNVDPMREMARLIMVQRTFEDTASLVRKSEATLDDAIKTLGSKT
ncbi:MAG: flagellar basal-body rod protein FlgF [Rhizobiaceae bacterium]|nr:flagellar basal-body rod protein FlgF [Hyphomicrobiales bacterium]